MDTSLEYAVDLDNRDPLARFGQKFIIKDPDEIYLDGNSLGRASHRAVAAATGILDQWASQIVRGWENGWLELTGKTSDNLEELLHAEKGTVAVTDFTSINLYKLAMASMLSGRRVIASNVENFPTDIYVGEGIVNNLNTFGVPAEYNLFEAPEGITPERIREVLRHRPEETLLMLSHVDYRTGRMLDMKEINRVAHELGAQVLWDLCHSAGAVSIDLSASDTDLAAGCAYKFFNSGPMGPGFVYVRPELLADESFRNPIRGWFGHKNQFEFSPEFVPYDNANKFMTSSPDLKSVASLNAAIEITLEAGMEAIGQKARDLTSYFVELHDEILAQYGFSVATPRDPYERGSHISLRHENAYQISKALREAKVIPDFRPPDLIRFGFTPLYTSFEEVHETVRRLENIMETKAYEKFPATVSGVP